MCDVCAYKDQEIAYLRETIHLLLVKKEQETSTFTPYYTNDYGQKIENTQKVSEAKILDDSIKEEIDDLGELT